MKAIVPLEAAGRRHEQSGRPLPPRRPARPQRRRPVEARPPAASTGVPSAQRKGGSGSDPAKSGKPPLLAALLVLLALFSGCGYHVAGRGAALPAGTRVIAVLAFANHTAQPGLSQMVSAAVAREFELQTRDRVQAAAAGSDVVVHGNVVSVAATPVTFDTTSGHATTVEVVVHLQAWVTATATGKEVFRNNDLVFHDQYQISTQEQNFIEEDSIAFQRLSQTIAQTLVSDILEAF